MCVEITAPDPAICRRRSNRRNFWLHVSEGTFASFTGVLLGGGIIMPILVKQLGAEPYILGIMGSISGFAVASPLLFAPYIESIHQKKKLVLFLGIGQRIPFILIAFVLWLYSISAQDETAAYMCLIGIAFLNLTARFSSSLLVPPWMDLVAETISDDDKPRLFGYRNGLSSAMGFFSGAIVSWILAAIAFPDNFMILYLAGFFAMVISWLLFSQVDEMSSAYKPKKRQPAGIYFRELAGILKKDSAYRWFIAYQAINQIGFVAMPYYAYVAVGVHNMNPALAAGAFIMIRQASNSVANFVFSEIAAKLGNKPILAAGSALHALAMILAAIAPTGSWFYAVFFIWGLAMAAMQVAGAPFAMAVAPSGRRIGYMSLSQVALAPVSIVFPMLAGWVIYTLDHRLLFLTTAAMMAISIFPLFRCQPVNNSSPKTTN